MPGSGMAPSAWSEGIQGAVRSPWAWRIRASVTRPVASGGV